MDSIINFINEYSIFVIIGLSVITLLLFIITIILLVSVKKLESKYQKMMCGVDNKNLEQVIEDNLGNVEKALNRSQEAIDECKNISEELKGCINNVSIIRYKAFEDIGSDLSFSIAILDSYNDGVIITGIYSRHDSTTYAKPIDKGRSKYDLSEEELKVLNDAINSKS